jgi:molybdate transport system substrate-binding protein
MNALNILSGGAAQGLVGSLAAKFKALTGLDIEGEFGAVGAMADKLRQGAPTDIVILTAALVAKLADEKLVVPTSIMDVGLVETALAVRSADPLVGDRRALRAAFPPPTRSSYRIPGINGPESVAKVLEQLGISGEVAARLDIYRTAQRHAPRRRPTPQSPLAAVDRNHQHEG